MGKDLKAVMTIYHLNRQEKNLHEVLRSGDLNRIRSLNLDDVLEHFGPDSFEHLAVQQRLADETNSLLSPGSSPSPVQYKVPALSESPLTNVRMLRRWIRDFTTMNDLELPSGFWKKNRSQLEGMYQGMLDHYGIHPEQTRLDGFYWKPPQR